ncbi:nuclear transport factor 2 family protein [Pseudonocardia kujensis]|uniref:nuclear transport factor 2 family protein n=1 Tax=Pseudonocardia kujensis TaxID=1128675 RepID=UPI001E61BF68|nr:nuclear transport factor 2 family protein [Pseudonocardia kujensis]MCE0764212.1 nuclear transport factor 2 family protein [Pseudonocardia kujensis]
MTVTPSTSTRAVQDGDLIDRLAVREVLERYTHAMDRRDEELMRSCFTPDADLSYFGGLRRFTGHEFADTFVSSLEPFGFIDHSISSPRITVDGDTASLDVHLCATMALRDDPVVLVRWVRVTDELVREPSGWKVAKRRHVPQLQYESPTSPIDFPGVGGKDPADVPVV